LSDEPRLKSGGLSNANAMRRNDIPGKRRQRVSAALDDR
jgi:hypothetical protein